MLREIIYTPDGGSALHDIDLFSEVYGACYAKAGEVLTVGGQDQLFTVFDFPAEHWIRLRTTSPIELALRRSKPERGRQRALPRERPAWRWH